MNIPTDDLDHEHPCADQDKPLGVYVADGREYPDVASVMPGPHRDSLAQLFAAAPDLYRAVKRVLEAVVDGDIGCTNHKAEAAVQELLSDASAAIVKAGGHGEGSN